MNRDVVLLRASFITLAAFTALKNAVGSDCGQRRAQHTGGTIVAAERTSADDSMN